MFRFQTRISDSVKDPQKNQHVQKKLRSNAQQKTAMRAQQADKDAAHDTSQMATGHPTT
jgi:hypothetical protein